MSDSTARPAPAERRWVLLLMAAVILVFGLSECRAAHHLLWETNAVRLLWVSGILAVAWASDRVRPEHELALFTALGLLCAASRTALVALTGGAQSPTFIWLAAMPLAVAVVVQDHPWATLATTAGTLAGGLGLLLHADRPPGDLLEWVAQASAMGGLAIYASWAYRALRVREARAGLERQQALERALVSESERKEALERALMLEGERRARQAAEEALRGRDEFLSVASHEFKTPLTALKLQVQGALRLLRQHPGPPEWTRRLGGLERSVDRLATLVDTLLDVSRIRMGRLALAPEEVDLSALVQETAERFAPQLEPLGSRLELRVQPRVVGRWDRVRLEQVVTNLLSNAAKYGAGSPVEVELSAAGGAAHLSVRDQGIGIAPADQARIFGRFERVVSEKQYAGLGLGLWIAEQVVLALDGEISVESDLGHGATFHVRLPLAPAATTPAGRDLH
jgi:signal transduction histidine kinase